MLFITVIALPFILIHLSACNISGSGNLVTKELSFSNFEERLTRATPEDSRFVLESLGAKVIAYLDGTWDMEIELPKQVQSDVQIEHSVPSFISP